MEKMNYFESEEVWQQRKAQLREQEFEMAQLARQKALEMLQEWEKKPIEEKAEDLVNFLTNAKPKRRKKN